ncbi:MAG: hypothetical protein EOO23_07455, partial [Comamonadaceae bacterium]
MIDWELNEEQQAIQDAARKFAQSEIAPLARDVDLGDLDFPEPLLGKMAAQGYFGMGIGQEHGGLGLDTLSMGLVTEQFCHASLAMGSILQRNWLCGHILQTFGTPAQKARWLPGMSSGADQSCTSGTEPEAGSDAANIKTTARLDGAHYVVNGSKQYMHDGLSNTANLSFRRYRGTAFGADGALPNRYFTELQVTPIKSYTYAPTGDQGTQFFY